ncbi:MAG: dTDP-4-dehydrorhamnose 3,5-epimerase [Oscillospiraceae bacterium]|nr:dTDP-4-dehydrorhamnose 3,5-epimerase [Oscillospiraceae bacterium]
MEAVKTKLDGVLLVKPDIFDDNRGWFFEMYSYKKYSDLGIKARFIQDNRSKTVRKGTIRGLHFQKKDMAQSKLITCTKGTIKDVVVDIRKNSKSYKRWIAVTLSEDNKYQLFIPKGFAHGFLTLTDDVEILYKVDEYYSAEHDRSICFSDPGIGVRWDTEDPVLSDKDKNAPLLQDSDADF